MDRIRTILLVRNADHDAAVVSRMAGLIYQSAVLALASDRIKVNRDAAASLRLIGAALEDDRDVPIAEYNRARVLDLLGPLHDALTSSGFFDGRAKAHSMDVEETEDEQ
jgi:hypothetical protein